MSDDDVTSCGCGKCWCLAFATEGSPVCEACERGVHASAREDLQGDENADPRPGAAPPRKCVRHVWDKGVLVNDFALNIVRCVRCHKVQDAEKVKAGRNNRSRGGRHELNVARAYGGEKIGHHGGPADVVNDLVAIQVKTHRTSPPIRLLRLLEAMDSGAGGRVPIVIDRYLRLGRTPVDIVTLRGSDWIALHGPTGGTNDDPL